MENVGCVCDPHYSGLLCDGMTQNLKIKFINLFYAVYVNESNNKNTIIIVVVVVVVVVAIILFIGIVIIRMSFLLLTTFLSSCLGVPSKQASFGPQCSREAEINHPTC